MSFRERRRRVAAARLPARVVVYLALAGSVMAAGGLGGAARANDSSEARRHAQRATSLAASGKCRQAVLEFDKALAILRDPALLFNRAECHRKLGDGDAAIDDYERFLADLPRAPNRAEVEKRIADLQRQSAATAVAAAPPPRDLGDDPPARGTTARVGQRAGVRTPPSLPSRAKDAAASREVVLTPRAPMASREREDRSATQSGGAIATASDTAPPSSSEAGVAGRPWFWIGVAMVAVGAGVGSFFLLNRDGTNVPASALGNYKF